MKKTSENKSNPKTIPSETTKQEIFAVTYIEKRQNFGLTSEKSITERERIQKP